MNRRNFFFGLTALATIKALPAQTHRAATKAWVRFTSGGWVGSGISSVTRNGAGDYTVLFTANMQGANYVGDVVWFQPLDSSRKSA